MLARNIPPARRRYEYSSTTYLGSRDIPAKIIRQQNYSSPKGSVSRTTPVPKYPVNRDAGILQ
jgi:hypothetical protein